MCPENNFCFNKRRAQLWFGSTVLLLHPFIPFQFVDRLCCSQSGIFYQALKLHETNQTARSCQGLWSSRAQYSLSGQLKLILITAAPVLLLSLWPDPTRASLQSQAAREIAYTQKSNGLIPWSLTTLGITIPESVSALSFLIETQSSSYVLMWI